MRDRASRCLIDWEANWLPRWRVSKVKPTALPPRGQWRWRQGSLWRSSGHLISGTGPSEAWRHSDGLLRVVRPPAAAHDPLHARDVAEVWLKDVETWIVERGAVEREGEATSLERGKVPDPSQPALVGAVSSPHFIMRCALMFASIRRPVPHSALPAGGLALNRGLDQTVLEPGVQPRSPRL